MPLQKQRLFWVTLFLIMILAAFILPFTSLMNQLFKVYGAFLFWNLFAIVVIVCLGFITSRWRDDDER